MPWCRRAFVFNISHLSSALFLGIFDYDPEMGPLAHKTSIANSSLHSPIGRIEIHVSNFSPDTVYTLAVGIELHANVP